MDFKQARKTCAECSEIDYGKCKTCRIYTVLNKSCELCFNIGGVLPLAISTSKGLVKLELCLRCFEKLV